MKVSIKEIDALIIAMGMMKHPDKLFLVVDNQKQFDMAKKIFPDNVKIVMKDEKHQCLK